MADRQAETWAGEGRRAGRVPGPATRAGSGAGQSAEEVFQVIKRAAYFFIFAVPDPEALSTPSLLVPFIPAAVYEIAITEGPRRLHISASPPTAECGFRTSAEVSRDPVAQQHLVMQPIPNNFESAPGRRPPPTLLLPFLSQRFWMYNGHFDFLDGRGSGFRAIAGGRFFPANIAGTQGLRIGGVAEIVEGLGALRGMQGNLAINGFTVPPAAFANLFTFRFVDVEGRLTADAPPPPIVPLAPNPTAGNAFLPLLAELHPDYPVATEPVPGSRKKRVHLVELLRLADNVYDIGPGVLNTRTFEGPVVGERRTTLVFDPDDPNDTIPLYSVDSVFRFFTSDGRTIGTLQTNLFEGRAFRTTLPQLERPFFRYVGFGPLQQGTGQFNNLVGMLTVNGALCLAPGALSSMYVIRISDPLGRFRSLRDGG